MLSESMSGCWWWRLLLLPVLIPLSPRRRFVDGGESVMIGFTSGTSSSSDSAESTAPVVVDGLGDSVLLDEPGRLLGLLVVLLLDGFDDPVDNESNEEKSGSLFA